MGSKRLRFIPALAIILFMASCGDDNGGGVYYYSSSGCGINVAYTGFYIVTLDITSTGDQCDPGEIPPSPTRLEFGNVTVDGDCDLFFDELGLLNNQTVLIDFWGDLRDDRLWLITADGDQIDFFVVDFEDGDTIRGIFWWDVSSDCVVEGTFTVIIG
jgi:hypothetical protein